MTIQELTKLLSTYPPEMLVYVDTQEAMHALKPENFIQQTVENIQGDIKPALVLDFN